MDYGLPRYFIRWNRSCQKSCRCCTDDMPVTLCQTWDEPKNGRLSCSSKMHWTSAPTSENTNPRHNCVNSVFLGKWGTPQSNGGPAFSPSKWLFLKSCDPKKFVQMHRTVFKALCALSHCSHSVTAVADSAGGGWVAAQIGYIENGYVVCDMSPVKKIQWVHILYCQESWA